MFNHLLFKITTPWLKVKVTTRPKMGIRFWTNKVKQRDLIRLHRGAQPRGKHKRNKQIAAPRRWYRTMNINSSSFPKERSFLQKQMSKDHKRVWLIIQAAFIARVWIVHFQNQMQSKVWADISRAKSSSLWTLRMLIQTSIWGQLKNCLWKRI